MDTGEALFEAAQLHESTQLSESGQEEQTFEDCIESVGDEEIPHLLGNESKFKDYCNKLLENFKDFEDREKALEQLLSTIKRLEVRSEYLLAAIEIWTPQREELLNAIRENIRLMNPTTKLLTATRIVGSVIDSASLIGSFLVKESNAPTVDMTIQAANVFGFLSFISSGTELLYWKAKLEEIMQQIQNDQNLLAPIQEWFLKNTELEEATKAVFSFDISHIVSRFERLMKNGISDSGLLQVLLESALREDIRLFRNVDLIGRMVAFARSPASRYWFGWVILRHHKVTLHIARMLLQMNNPQVLASSHSVSTLARSVPNLTSVSFWGRIGINCLTLYEDINTLRTGGIVEELRQLLNHLEQEMIALLQISRLIKQRSE